MKLYNTKGIIIKQNKVSASGKLLSIVTPTGKISAMAYGIGKFNTPVKGCELFNFSEFSMEEKLSYTTIKSSDLITNFPNIILNMEKFALANYFSQLLDFTCSNNVNLVEHMRLMLNSLYFLDSDTYNFKKLKPIFELNIITLFGFKPNLADAFFANIHPSTLAAIDYIINSKNKYHFNINDDILYELIHISEKYIYKYIDNKLTSLTYYHSIVD